MKEVTRIITMEITAIRTVYDGEEKALAQAVCERIKSVLNEEFHLDNINITNVQDFERDLEEKEKEQ